MKNRILSFLLVLVLLNTLTITANAAHPVPDLSRNGSMIITMDLAGVKLDDGNLNLYKVGNIVDTDGNYSFQPVAELQMGNQDLDVSERDLAEELLDSAKNAHLQKITAPIIEGEAVFTELPVGLYVVWQNKQDATKGYRPIQPFLISVPRFENDEYILDVTADPKVPLETTPPDESKPTEPNPTEPNPTTPPPSERLPQTGQLNWPIPVMAASGIVLFFVGWILCLGRKRTENEK